MTQTNNFFKKLAAFMKEHPEFSRKRAIEQLKLVNQVKAEPKMTCPGCGMLQNIISDNCGRCGIIFSLTETE